LVKPKLGFNLGKKEDLAFFLGSKVSKEKHENLKRENERENNFRVLNRG